MLILKVLSICVILSFHSNAFAKENTGSNTSRSLLIGMSFSIPPYIIQEENSGIELEILRKSLEVNNYLITPSYLPLARSFQKFQSGELDAVLNVKEGVVDGFLSDVIITFRNYAVTLEERSIKIEKITDLGNKSVAAFQRASKLLGGQFEQAVRHNSLYSEVADQSLQLKRLYKSRAEVIILEKKIFKYLRKRLYDASLNSKGGFVLSIEELRKPVLFHDIIPANDYRVAFRSEHVRDHFNEGLRAIRKNKIYDNIIAKYDDEMRLDNAVPQ